MQKSITDQYMNLAYFLLCVIYTNLFQFLLCLCLHLPDIIHSQLHPFIDRTEELSVEVIEDPLLLLIETVVVFVRARQCHTQNKKCKL